MKDVNVSQDTNVEGKSQVKKREQGKVDNHESRTYSLAKKFLGVATAALLAGGAMADLSRTEASSSALRLAENNNLTDRIPPPLPSPEHLRILGISDLKRFYREVSQRTSGEETLPDFRSRKMTLGRKTSRSAMETPSRQLEQGKSKRTEAPELSKEVLQSFVEALGENKEALQGFKKVLNDTEAMEGIKNLMEDKKFRKYALSELRSENSVKQAISLLENNTCVTPYRAYVHWAHSYYRNCCKDEAGGTPVCGEKKEDWANIVRNTAIAVSVVVVAASLLRWCCKDDGCLDQIPERWIDPIPERQNNARVRQGVAARVEMPLRQNDESGMQQLDSNRDSGPLSRTDSSSSEEPLRSVKFKHIHSPMLLWNSPTYAETSRRQNDKSGMQQLDPKRDSGSLSRTDGSSSKEPLQSVKFKYIDDSMLLYDRPTYAEMSRRQNDESGMQQLDPKRDSGSLSRTGGSGSEGL
jgi:hypothetical protein